MSSPTKRSMDYLRKKGYRVAIVERWIPVANKRIDLYGCIDILGIKDGEKGSLGIQTTTRSNMPSRLNKILESDDMRLWLSCGNRLIIHGWYKKANRWFLKEREVKLHEFSEFSRSQT